MISAITITEVLGRSEQGMTLPFLCRGDDGRLYYVKGRYAGQRSLCCEWIAGHLARAMELPLPEFVMAEVPDVLVSESDRDDIADLGSGWVFASALVEGAHEITWEEAQACPAETQSLVLLFDSWVQNEDRSLSSLGGNPNLLISSSEVVAGTLWVYDFNLAFDPDFSSSKLRENHLFSALLREWPLGFRETMNERMRSAITQLDKWFSSIPDEWLYLHGERNQAVQLDRNLVTRILMRPFDNPDTFWRDLL